MENFEIKISKSQLKKIEEKRSVEGFVIYLDKVNNKLIFKNSLMQRPKTKKLQEKGYVVLHDDTFSNLELMKKYGG